MTAETYTPSDPELPTVSLDESGVPTLDFGGRPAPVGLRVEALTEGTGPVVSKGDDVEVHYLGQVWGGDIFDSSYRRGSTISFPIGVGSVIQGWDRTIVGQQVGSRLLISIPPSYGYGSRGMPQAGIRGTDTLVFVVDIAGRKPRR